MQQCIAPVGLSRSLHPVLLLGLGTLTQALLQYVVKPCVRGFSEIPTDVEFESGDLSLVMDDHNPGRGCWCLPGYFKRLTVNAKVTRLISNVQI